jgi:hypothetical protein
MTVILYINIYMSRLLQITYLLLIMEYQIPNDADYHHCHKIGIKVRVSCISQLVKLSSVHSLCFLLVRLCLFRFLVTLFLCKTDKKQIFF